MFDDYLYGPFGREDIKLKDYGPEPFVTNIERAALQNDYFRIALWTGEHLQLTLMSIDVRDSIGLEMHPNLDQFLYIVRGKGLAMMGESNDHMNFHQKVYEDYVVFIPAGTWHNLVNTGNEPIKLFSIYAPPAHKHGTIHKTKDEAEEYSF